MSNIEVKPSISAIFNSSEFQIFATSNSKGKYVTFPLGQGTETFPSGMATNNLTIGGSNTATNLNVYVYQSTFFSSYSGTTTAPSMVISDTAYNLTGNVTITNRPTFISTPQVLALKDSSNSLGTAGSVLTSTSTGTLWGPLSYTTNMIGSPVLYTSITTTPIVFPAGTVTATIMLIGGGGNGSAGLISGTSITNGGVGSAGSIVIYSRIPCANGVFTCQMVASGITGTGASAQLSFVNSSTNKPANMSASYPLIASANGGVMGSPATSSANGASGVSGTTLVSIATMAPTYTTVGGSGPSTSVASTAPYYTQVPSQNAIAGAYQSYCQGGYYTNQIITTPTYYIGTYVAQGTGCIVVMSYLD